MASLSSGLLQLPSKPLRSGLRIIQPVDKSNHCGADKLDLSLRPIIEVGSQYVGINHSRSWEINPTLERNLRDLSFHVDVHSLLCIDAQLGEGKNQWDPETGIRSLGNWLTHLGTSYLDFKYWDTLTIELPMMELPFDPNNGPILPIENMARLRHLTWSGHPAQLRASFLPFSPLLLRNLETLTITCNLSLDDCIHILREAISLQSLTLRTIRHPAVMDSFVSTFRSERNRTILPRLVTLELRSEVDICLLIRHFDFPSLSTLFLGFVNTSQSDLENSESFHWADLKNIVICSDLSAEGMDKIRNDCVNATSVELEHPLDQCAASWYRRPQQLL